MRVPAERHDNALIRGALVANFLDSQVNATNYIAKLNTKVDEYNGFNLLIHDGQELIWYSNKGQSDARNGQPLGTRIYILSNALLDVCSSKVVRTKAQFASMLCQGAPDETYFEMLSDTTNAGDYCL